MEIILKYFYEKLWCMLRNFLVHLVRVPEKKKKKKTAKSNIKFA